ncbi:unnamed protein product, partial [Amoebophrya sp. A25]
IVQDLRLGLRPRRFEIRKAAFATERRKQEATTIVSGLAAWAEQRKIERAKKLRDMQRVRQARRLQKANRTSLSITAPVHLRDIEQAEDDNSSDHSSSVEEGNTNKSNSVRGEQQRVRSFEEDAEIIKRKKVDQEQEKQKKKAA